MLELLLGSHAVILTFKLLINIISWIGLEFLDFSVTAILIAQSDSRASGLLVAKWKSVQGMLYDVFTKLYDSIVWSVIAYGAAVLGDKTYSCINAVQNRDENIYLCINLVQNRAMRLFLGVGKYTPNAAVSGDIGWPQPASRRWKSVSLQ